MSLARKYRLQFAVKGDRLVLYLATAVSLHAGIVAGSLVLGQRSQLSNPVTAIQPIEFVYLDAPNKAASIAIKRHARVNAIAAGQSNSALTIKTGKSELKQSSRGGIKGESSKPIAASLPTLASTVIPTSSHESKALLPGPVESTHKPSTPAALQSRPSSPAAAQPVISPGGNLAIQPPVPQPLPSLQPDRLNPPTPDITTVNSVSPQGPPSPVADALPEDHSVDAGRGLDEAFNPDRTTPSHTGSVDAVQDPVWGEYTAALTQKINQHWQRIGVDATREPKVRFVIDRQGAVLDLQLVQPSGSDDADRAALQAVQAAAPFEPLPAAANEERLVVNFTFTYSVSPKR